MKIHVEEACPRLSFMHLMILVNIHLNKGTHNEIKVNIIELIKLILVLSLKVLFILEKLIWQTNDIHEEREDDQEWR